MIILEKYDDIAGNEDPPRMVKATETHTVSLDGETVELDLSEQNAARICDYLRTLIKVGKPVHARAAPAEPKGQQGPAGRIIYPPSGPVKGRRPRDPGVSAYRFLLRTWCADYNITRDDDPQMLAFKTATGGWNYPLNLLRKFEGFLDSEPGQEWLARQDPDAVATLQEHRKRDSFIRIVASAH